MSQILATSRRLIVKIGSALLVDDESGDVRRAWLQAVVEDIAHCRSRGQEVVVVSSGAVADTLPRRRHLCGLLRQTSRDQRGARR